MHYYFNKEITNKKFSRGHDVLVYKGQFEKWKL